MLHNFFITATIAAQSYGSNLILYLGVRARCVKLAFFFVTSWFLASLNNGFQLFYKTSYFLYHYNLQDINLQIVSALGSKTT